MKAKLIRIDTNSPILFDEFSPDDPSRFGVWLNVSVGADGLDGADDFQVLVCNKAWLKDEAKEGRYPEKYLLLKGRFTPTIVESLFNEYLDDCHGDDWNEIVNKVSRIGNWEFQDYKS